MRYYNIIVTNTDGSLYRQYTSQVGGQNNPGALNVILDIPTIPFATPMGGAVLQIWGIPLSDISQASDFNGKNIQIFGGMAKGLPLAKPQQQGLLVQGYIYQAFGNWEGTRQTLDFIIQAGTAGTSGTPGTGTPSAPRNLSFNWLKGTQLSDAIKTTLATAFPGYTSDINISPNLVLPHDEPGFYQTIGQFAQYVYQISRSIIPSTDYAGVNIVLTQSKFSVYDGTTAPSVTYLAFTDLIGQPTWIDPLTIQAHLVMRGDLMVGNNVKFPPSVVTNSQAGNAPQVNAKVVFQGNFQIKQMRHVGNFRQRDAQSWVTVIDAFSVKVAA